MRITTNPDRKCVEDIRKAIKGNDNHCPSKAKKSQDTLCMCKAFRDMINNGESGYCECQLYRITNDD